MVFVARIAKLGMFVCVLLGLSLEAAQAAGTGLIAGTVTDSKTGAPIAGAIVLAVSPSDRYRATTDAAGRFVFAGVTVDTYSISVQKQGYQIYSLQGATITQNETFRVTARLDTGLRTIAKVASRARLITSAFQPDQTIDRTVVNAQGIDQLLGKAFDTNGKQLLSELPGVTVDRNGTVLVRGGTSFEGALEFEGIDYTEPNRSLSDRFENVGSNYLLSGVGSIEIIPGAGDATRGDTGTGLIALTAKRGTYPQSGTLDYEQVLVGHGHQIGLDYGIATPDNRLSNYFNFIAEDQYYHYGPFGVDAASQIADPTSINPDLQAQYTANQRNLYTTSVFNRSFQASRDFIDNAIVKFGHGGSQQLQFFLQSQTVNQTLDYGGYKILTAVPRAVYYNDETSPARINNPFLNPSGSNTNSFDFLFGGFSPFRPPTVALPTSATASSFVKTFVPTAYGGVSGKPLTAPETIDSPFSAYKVEYDNNFNATTSFELRGYRTDNAATEVLPSQGLYVPQEGGIRRGIATDITKVLGDKHTLRFGGKYEFTQPFGSRIDSIDYTGAFLGNYNSNSQSLTGQIPNFGAQTHDIIADFVQPLPTNTLATGPGGGTAILAGTPGCIGSPPYNQQAPQEHCGYLYRYFPNGPPPLPSEVEVPTANQQSYGLYLQDTYAPNARLHVLAGLRLDGYNFLIPSDPQNPPAVDGIRHQRLYEPKIGLSYRLGNRDAVRTDFGRSLAIPLPTFLGANIDRSSLGAFANIPSYDSVTGQAATYCGVAKPFAVGGSTYYLGNQTCTSYADQLYWLLRDARFAQQAQITSPLRGATFTNYDFTYSHEFPGGVAVKLTPFYRRGYDVVETTQTLLGIDPNLGTQLLSPELESNLGFQRATGFEFEATTPQRPAGLSATVSATYVNQFGNDPPGDYLPTASLLLGEQYHSPNIAPLAATLAATYRTKWGLRINPIFTFKSGYPYGTGVYEALTVNGQPYYIPYTDAVYQGVYAGLLANAQVNPQYPGTLTNPNIFATRGTEARTAGPGSLASPQSLNLDITASITPPPGRGGFTYGVAITNLFDRTSSVPYPNYTQDCQVIYTGLCAATGLPSVQDPYHHQAQTANSPLAPYVIFTNGLPIAVRLFVQAAL